MNTEEAFERDILDHPFDDTCRLIYADWLEERGDERGEFLRLQHNLSRMSIGDATKSVTYLDTYSGLRKVLDAEYFKKIAETKPPFLLRSEQIAGRLVSGEDLMAFTGMPTRAYQYNQKGAKLKFMLPEEGVVLLPQSMFILKKAPHPNAAKLWIDFMLSERGQEALVRGEALISGRAGFKSPLPEYAPSMDSLKIIKIDWESVSTAELQKMREEWTRVFNP